MTRPKIRWLERSMLFSPYLTLVTSEAEYAAALKHLKRNTGDEDGWLANAAHAEVKTFTNQHGEVVCVVSIRPTMPVLDAALTLGHEALHIFRRFCDHIGEESPGEEMEAHCIKSIAVSLTDEYVRRVEALAPSPDTGFDEASGQGEEVS